jgi:arylformamidase
VSTPALASALAVLRGLSVHDASPAIEPQMPMFMVYEPPELTRLFSHAEAGAAANRLSLAEHTGTHVDAPFHFVADGAAIDEIAPDALLLRPDPQPGEAVGAATLREAAQRAGVALEPGDVAILEMGWDRHAGTAFWGRNEPGLDDDACEWLVQAGVAAVASDTPGCDVAVADGQMSAGHGHDTWFLPRGILIVEGLQGLARVPATGVFVALPLRIRGGTGSPVRVLLLHER